MANSPIAHNTTIQNEDQIPKLRRDLPVLTGSSFLIGGALLLFQSLLQPFALYLGASISIVGVLVSLASFTKLIPMLIFGSYSDSVGRRRPLIISSLLLIVSGLLLIVATQWWSLILPIFLIGIATALDQPTSIAATAESAAGTKRGKAFAYRAAGRLMAGVVIALLGIVVLQYWNVQITFFLFLAFVGINLGLIYFFLIETRSFSYVSSSVLKNLRNIFHIHPKLKGLYVYVIITDSFTYGISWHLINGLLVDFQGVTYQEVLLYMMLTSLAGGLVQFGIVGQLVDRTRKWAIVLSDSIAVPTFLVFAFYPSKQTFLIAFVVMGIAVCFWRPAVQAFVVDRVGRENIAAEFGKLWGLKGIVGIFPPIIGGILAENYGYQAPLIAGAFAGVFSILVAIFLLTRIPNSSKTIRK